MLDFEKGRCVICLTRSCAFLTACLFLRLFFDRDFALPHHEDTFDEFLLDIEGIENGTVMSLEDEAFGAPPQFVPMPHWNEVDTAKEDAKMSPCLGGINSSSSRNSGETQQCVDSDSSHSNHLHPLSYPQQPMNQAQFFSVPQPMMAPARSSYMNLQAMAMTPVLMANYPSFMPSSMMMMPSMEPICTQLRSHRQEALLRYRQKRARRMINGGGVRKKVRYTLRKINADRRPRIKGRFIKKGEIVPGLETAASMDGIAEMAASIDESDTEEEMEDEDSS